jgi:hypothetical protein
MVSRMVFLFPHHHQIDLPTSKYFKISYLHQASAQYFTISTITLRQLKAKPNQVQLLSKTSTMSYINGSTSANGGNGADNIQYAEFLNYPYVANGGWECHRCGCGSRTNTATTQWRPENYPRARRNREPLCADPDCGHYRC